MGTAPIQWKGGQVQELWKGKGPLSDPASYRDIWLCALGSKGYSRFLMTGATTWVNSIALDTQFGSGINGAGADFCHLMLKGLADFVDSSWASLAIIFLDIVSAFASMARAMALSMPEYEHDLIHVLHRLGFQTDAITVK